MHRVARAEEAEAAVVGLDRPGAHDEGGGPPERPPGEGAAEGVEGGIPQSGRGEAGQGEAARALAEPGAGAELPVAVEEIGPGAGRPPVLDLVDDGHPRPGDPGEEGEGVPGEMMDVDDLRPDLGEEPAEVGGESPVVEGVPRQGVALDEVVDRQPHPDPRVEELDGVPQRALGIGDPGVDGDLPPLRLPAGEPGGVDLGPRLAPGRPAVDDVEHPLRRVLAQLGSEDGRLAARSARRSPPAGSN